MTSSKKKFAPKSISLKKLSEGIANDVYYASSDAPLLHKGYTALTIDKPAFAKLQVTVKHSIRRISIPVGVRGNLVPWIGKSVRVWYKGINRNGRVELFIK